MSVKYGMWKYISGVSVSMTTDYQHKIWNSEMISSIHPTNN